MNGELQAAIERIRRGEVSTVEMVIHNERTARAARLASQIEFCVGRPLPERLDAIADELRECAELLRAYGGASDG